QSPANVERVQRATERLEARLGPSPHVSQPLEPAAQDGPVKEAGLIREARPASTAASAPSSTPSPASPPAHPNPPQSPQTVRSAAHGKPASPVSNSDAKAPPVPLPLTLPPAGAGAYQYRVRPRTLAMRLTPEVNASVVAQLHQGDIVLGLLVLPQGKWTAVEHRQGDQVQRGWVTTQWLVQVEPN
ncbi:MAG TPA: hypothetical protein VFP68_21355, partial [Burkholderiaceae bacterium]|nr:hypothetical protein [Burkholderiaceae bacterium]